MRLRAQASGRDRQLKPIERVWVYMPFMHSEAVADQEECVRLFNAMGEEAAAMPGGEGLAKMLANNSKYAVAHLDVVKQWGRFPHRNAILARDSTPEEAAAMAAGTIASF